PKPWLCSTSSSWTNEAASHFASRARILQLLDRALEHLGDPFALRLVLGPPGPSVDLFDQASEGTIDLVHAAAQHVVDGFFHTVDDVVDAVPWLAPELPARLGDLVDLLSFALARLDQALVLEPLQRRVDRSRRRRVAAVQPLFQGLHHLVSVHRLLVE